MSADYRTNASPTRARKPYADVLKDRQEALRSMLEKIAPTRRAMTLELGCGHGHFLTAYAAAYPGKLCIGIDIVGERIERAQRKRDRAQLDNLHFIRTDGNLFLSTLGTEPVIEEMFILFPDPWPKSRHHKHRILQYSFLAAAAGAMVPEGMLCFRTDYRPYFDEAASRFEEHPSWKLSHEPWPFEYQTVFQARASAYFSLIARTTPHRSSHKTDGEKPRAA